MPGFNNIELPPSIPVAEYDLTNNPLKTTIFKLIKRTLTTPHSLVFKGKSSHNNFSKLESVNFLYNEPKLYHEFQGYVNEFCDYLGVKRGTITQSWFNKMEKGGYTLPHVHWGSIVVGAYYPKLESGTCDLLLTNPTRNLHGAQLPLKKTDYTLEKYKIKVKQDHLYLFPGWVEHSTEINTGGERIVISLNAMPWGEQN